jgi:predicted anti-sigma-YlaC factor YlaD
MKMDCHRAEELYSDRLEGSLHPILGAQLEAHLAACAACRELVEALAEVVAALRSAPELEAPETLAERAASAALARPLAPESQLAHPRGRTIEIRPAFVLPHWLNAAAAGLALIALGATLAVVGPVRGARAAQRLVGQTVTAGSSLMERKDRLLEDVRVLGVVLSTAFEGRIERVGERVNDYKRLLERRKPTAQPEPKQGRDSLSPAARVAAGFRTGAGSSS